MTPLRGVVVVHGGCYSDHSRSARNHTARILNESNLKKLADKVVLLMYSSEKNFLVVLISHLIRPNNSNRTMIKQTKSNSTQHNDSRGENEENVTVMVRCKPADDAAAVVQVDEENKCITVDNDRQYHFDAVLGPQCDNERVYMRSARRLVESAFNGFNCTIFLYGQTGTGKTYTHSSLTSNAFEHLFSLIIDSNARSRFLIRASYYELYNEEIHDLLSKDWTKPLELRESKARGVYVKDLTCYLVNNTAELVKIKRLGDKRRATAATKMNEHSSRSHSIFSITIETVGAEAAESKQQKSRQVSARSTHSVTNDAPVRVGRLHLIDLAGSERQSKSGSTGARLKEASRINLSLTCLSLVIHALTDNNSMHVPYRNSKLTRLLSSSLGGNSKTLLIACISMARRNLDETLSTLRFASRTKRVKNCAKVNEDAKDALLRKYRQQINELKSKLREQQEQSVVLDDENTIESSQRQDVSTNKSDNEMLQQLKMLRAKIMVGGENLLEKVEMHERLIEASRLELLEKQREERRLKEQLEKKRANIERVKSEKGSLQSQLDDLNDKLKHVLLQYKSSKDELKDLKSEHQQLKDNLLQSIRVTNRETKYADCIIEDFIPREYLDLINTYANYDDESDEWQIRYIALSGNNIAQTRRFADDNDYAKPTNAANRSHLDRKGIHEPLEKYDIFYDKGQSHNPDIPPHLNTVKSEK